MPGTAELYSLSTRYCCLLPLCLLVLGKKVMSCVHCIAVCCTLLPASGFPRRTQCEQVQLALSGWCQFNVLTALLTVTAPLPVGCRRLVMLSARLFRSWVAWTSW